MWGTIILFFAVLWILQILLSAMQLKHYQKTIREMSKHSSGYLGVGVDKRKLGVGSVVVLVCDTNGTVIESKKMYGVTVFQRFSLNESAVNKHIDDLNTGEDDKLFAATSMAISNIKTQMKAS
ncbi:transcriptional regulator GutM [Virgibacillus oceani]|uniref:Transcriptional regulator n=1 Tax=Virgibacillus oceani TaxID=1479511 RepID=A0A917M3S5_9BACI|nr:transcriptional regulator GutM [Virgibacillus oceani]GGG73542.1 hypothetical protein GCM10011398_17510 [Virgibacillus oceani]